MLTPRQNEIVSLLLQGADTQDIAKTLGISRNTVKHHIALLRYNSGVESSKRIRISLVNKYYSDSPSPLPVSWFKLSKRYKIVAVKASSGATNKEIAQDLDTSENVIKQTLHRVFDILGLFNRLELTIWCRQHGISTSSFDVKDKNAATN